MNEKKIARILDDCLSAIRSGKMSKAECLCTYPALASELEALLGTTEKLYSVSDIAIEKTDLRKMKMQMLNRLPDREQVVTKPSGFRYKWQTTKRRFAMTWIIIVTTLLSLLSGAGAVYASGDALPGDVLYPVKTWVEDVQLVLAPDDADTELLSKFSEYRVQEMIALYEQGRFDDLSRVVVGYQNRTQEMEKLIAEIQAKNPDEALKLRTELEQKLQEHARIIEGLIEDDSDENGELDHLQLQEMLETNTQTRLRMQDKDQESFELESNGDVSTSVVEESNEKNLDSTGESLQNGEQNQNGEMVNMNGSSEMASFTFRLQNASQDGVYAEVAGRQYPCTVEGDLVTCNINNAPSKATINLYKLHDHKWLYAFDYDYDWSGEMTMEDNGNQSQGEDMGGDHESGQGGKGSN